MDSLQIQNIVTLTGGVDSYVKKWAAEKAAHRIKGVHAVANLHVQGRRKIAGAGRHRRQEVLGLRLGVDERPKEVIRAADQSGRA